MQNCRQRNWQLRPSPPFSGLLCPSSKGSAPWPIGLYLRSIIHRFKILDLPLCSKNYSHNDKFTLLGSKAFILDASLTLQIWHRPSLSTDIAYIKITLVVLE